MKLPEPEDNINNINNDNQKEEINVQIHNIKESSMPIEAKDIQPENESGTVTTTIGFLKPAEDPLTNLNKSLENKNNNNNNSNNLSSSKDEKSVSTTDESFYQKTKRWAGTVWSYMNVKNYFPKAEYIEYRNANGDMVKIPKKKIPLKKKKVEVDDEQYIVNKTVDRDRIKMNFHAADNVPYASNFI
jgi:hypothetical protein